MVKTSLISLLLLHFIVLYGYGKDPIPDKEIEKYFTSILKNNSYSLSSDAIKNCDALKLLKLANKNYSNTDAGIRYKIIDLVKRKAGFVSDSETRSKYAEFLVMAINDPDSGNSGIASKSLTKFKASEFSKTAKDTLHALLKRKVFHYPQVVKLAGFVQPDGCSQYLEQKLGADSTLTTSDLWATHLALARMGKESSIQYCLNKVKSMPVNDNTVTYLFPDLVYTRQLPCIQVVLDQLNTDNPNCNSPNPDNDAKISCAYKILEMVAPVIIGFPVKTDKYNELETDNYDQALATARNWIASNEQWQFDNEIY